jgi:hypothetical protein
MIKYCDETYSGVRFEGFPEKEAKKLADELRHDLDITGRYIKLVVYTEKMPNGNFRVVNCSVYE